MTRHIGRRDGQRRVERRGHVADVAHVGRTGVFPRHTLHRFDPEAAEVVLEEPGQHGIVTKVGVGRIFVGEIQTAARRERRRLKDVLHLLEQLLHVGLIAGPDQEFTAGALGNDVGSGTALLEETVEPGSLLHLLAKHADPVVGEDKSVERVDPLFRVARGVRRPTDEFEMHVRDRQRPVQHLGPRVGMEHHRRVDFLEDAGVDQPDLAAATLLGRRADDEHATAQAIERLGQRNPGPGGGGRDQVVAAAVAEPTKRVVFGEEGNRRAGSIPARGDEGGGCVSDADLDPKTVLLEQLGQPGDGLPLFVGDLGIGMDIAANPFQLRPQCVDPGADRILELTGRRLSN